MFKGKVPRSEHERMRAPFQAGEFPGAREVRLLQRRRRRARARRARAAVTCSASIRIRRATSCRPARCTCCPTTCRRRAQCSPRISRPPSTRCGTQRRASAIASPSSAPAPSAASSAWLAARIAGAEVELIDVDERKSAAARALGVPFRAPAAARRDADVVLHTSGSAAGLATALELAGFEADRRRALAGTATRRRPCRSAARSTAAA